LHGHAGTIAPIRIVAPEPVARRHDLARIDDTTLVGMVADGSMAAFDTLVDRHAGALYRAALRVTADAHEAEDVVQDCFARLWQHAATWTPSGAGLVGWLHRVTMNLCLDWRRRSRAVTTPDLPEMIDHAPRADHAIEAHQLYAALDAALAALPARHRAALVLCYLQGHSNAAAATMLGMHVKALESLLHRARHALRSQLAAQQVMPDDLATLAGVERAPVAVQSA
jgi:RNA polymerase sigma-70 factor (ECF subfamily)